MSIIKGTNQIVAGFGGTKRSIGEVYFSQSALATDNSGALPLFTGETIASANTIYPEFYNWVTAHAELQCTAEEYESALSTYGECAKYVIGKIGDSATAPDYGTTTITAGSIRLPLIKNYIKAANTADGIKNIEAGLPDHNHTVSGSSNWGSLSQTGNAVALVTQVTTSNASNSNPIYGKSETVTPASTTLYPWVVAYTAAIPASTAQAAEFQQGLSGKADTNLGNLSAAGKDLASGLGMPSNRYTDLTLGASGTVYTAPANGFITLRYNTNADFSFCHLYNSSTSYGTTTVYNHNGLLGLHQSIEICGGSQFTIYYEGLEIFIFRFVYAEGAE